jgi:hypothetical protein
MNEKGQMSLQTLWSLLSRADLMPEDFDMDTEIALLKAEADARMEREGKQFDAGLESTP